jgi:hypothetical protein
MPFLFPFFGGVLVVVLLGLAALAFNIWMLVDAARRSESDFNPPQSRTWWIVGLAVGIFLGWLGLAVSLVYYFLVRKPVSEGKPAAQIFGSSPSFGGRPAAGAPGRTCRNCGEPLGTHARFCQNCGTPADLEDR